MLILLHFWHNKVITLIQSDTQNFTEKNTKDKILEWEGTSRSVSATQLTGQNNSSGEINHLTLEHIRG